MTRYSGSLELAHARLSARHALRADDASWRRIEHVREFPALLDLLRSTPLSRWTRGVLPSSDAHAIEASVRAEWREGVCAAIDWMPEDWQPALAWFATWPDVPILMHAARGATAWPWLPANPAHRPASGAPMASDESHAAATRLVQRSLARHDDVVEAWCDEWRRRMPEHGRRDPGLVALRVALGREHAASAAAGSGLRRRALDERLRTLFRAAALTPALAFVHLALDGLEMERLRGELVWRATFPAALAA